MTPTLPPPEHNPDWCFYVDDDDSGPDTIQAPPLYEEDEQTVEIDQATIDAAMAADQ